MSTYAKDISVYAGNPDARTQVPIPELDLWTFLFERESKPFDDDQVIYRDPSTPRFYTYGTTRSTAINFGRGLRALYQWRKGDVLALFSPNCIDSPSVIWGTHWAGGIVSPSNPAYTVDELALHLKDCGAKLLVTQVAQLEVALKACSKVGLPLSSIVLIGDKHDPKHKVIHLASVLAEGARVSSEGRGKQERTKLDSKKDLAFLVYSSGTTGVPKGVMLTHFNIVSDITMLGTIEGRNMVSGKDKIVAVLPYYHIYGLTTLIHCPLHRGLETLVMPSFDLPLFCRIIATHRITYGYVAPPVVLHLAKNPLVDNYDLSSLRFLTSGAAPLTKELILEVHKRIGLRVKQAYGLSETSPVSHVQEWDGSWLDCIGSVGPPLPNLEQIFVVPSASSSTSSSSSSSSSGGPSGGGGSLAGFTLCKPGEPGEMWLRGPTVFRGYLNNVEATKGCKTDDGWFKTGDIGFEDAQGNMYITDRVKELIKYKGSQVAPAELEGLLLSNADVEDVCVLGVYVDAAATEVPVAAVVLSPKVADRVKAEGDYESEARKIVEWMKARTAKSKWLRGGVVFVDVVHKSAAGKILRRLVKGDVEKAGMAGKVYAAQKWEERGGVKAKL